jgi:hypothetical protein
MEEPIISTTEESENEPQPNEDHIHRVFQHPWHRSREFVPQGQFVNTKFYCEVLRHFRENIRRKRPDLWHAKNWILHDDNAHCHRALLVREFLTNHNMLSLPHPLYSPDLAPSDFFLFPKMKMQLKGRRFHIASEIQCKSQTTTHTHT